MPPDFAWTAFVASVFDYPLAGCVPAEPASVWSKVFAGTVGSQELMMLFRSGFLVAVDEGLGGFVLGVVSPVGLHEDGVDLFEIDGFGLVADGFYQGTDAEVFDGPQRAFGEAEDEVDGFVGEGLVGQADEVELAVDVGGEGCRGQEIEFGGVGDAAFDVEVVAKLEGGVEGGLADEDEVVVFGEVF